MVVEASADPVIPLISSVPQCASVADAVAFVDRQRHRLQDGYGYSFVIAEIADPRAAPGDDHDRGIGSIGLWLRDIDLGRASVGYWVVPSARGRRVAGRALAAVVAWAFDELAVARLELYVEPWNVASIRTAERAGFVREGRLRSWQDVGGERRDVDAYSLLPADVR
jgi:RimJ/RimL family protein N-acetyltransferase